MTLNPDQLTHESGAFKIPEPSSNFKRRAKKVFASIVIFFILYFVMILLATLLTGLCIYAGFLVIVHSFSILGLLVGFGVMGLGVMIFVFLIKFLFAVSKTDQSRNVEITEQEQPALVAFIKQITLDTQTQFPKKIFLSPEVNACVFYDSSFWSMFFPVKKNLQIGLGVVNVLSVSEFKAVLAHEFGHFSQRSMKLGSYVYNLNRVIYNMLYQNKDYASFLRQWARIHSAFAFFASITVQVVRGIQWVLQQQYKVINKNYLSLSREMEFHADAVAAGVSGSNNMIMALRKVELGASCYDAALHQCDVFLKEKKRTSNLYSNQFSVMQFIANEFRLPLINNQVNVTNEFVEANNFSRVNYKDQWASYPTLNEREEHLNLNPFAQNTDNRSAWDLFAEPEKIQKELTEKVYSVAGIKEQLEIIDDDTFDRIYVLERKKNSYPEVYKGYYNGRWISDSCLTNGFQENGTEKFADLFSAEKQMLFKKIESLGNDLRVLQMIADKKIDANTFDFDGRKYKRPSVPDVKNKLEEELKHLQHLLEKNDETVVRFFYNQAARSSHEHEYENKLCEFFELKKQFDEYKTITNKLFENLGRIYSGKTIPIPEIQKIIGTLKHEHESPFKKQLSYWKEKGAFDPDETFKQKVEKFIQTSYAYFINNNFMNDELKALYEIYQRAYVLVEEFLFRVFKNITELQLTFLDNEDIESGN
jgi:Zn-dependent protease with chaperone function